MNRVTLVVLNYAERLFWTFVITFVTYALGQNVLDVGTAKAASMAGVAAIATLILGLITDWAIPTNLPTTVIIVLRVARTWIVSVLTVMTTVPPEKLFSTDQWEVAVIASWPVVFSILKNIATERLSGSGTPATLPAGSYSLKVTVIDQVANRVAETVVPVTITAANVAGAK